MRGFSLIEMLVVLAILVTIASIVLISYGRFGSLQAINRAAQDVAIAVRQVQSYALTTRADPAGTIPCGWGIHFERGQNSYIIFPDHPENTDCRADPKPNHYYNGAGSSEVMAPINLPGGVKILGFAREDGSAVNGPVDITYVPPDPAVFILNNAVVLGDQRVEITLKEPRGLYTRTIVIEKAGRVSIK